MSGLWKRGMGAVAVLALFGCGGPVVEESAESLSENRQELQRCGPDDRPCATGSYCDIKPGNYHGVCRPNIIVEP